MYEKQLIAYLRKNVHCEDEVDMIVSNTRDYGPHALALYHSSNGSHKILGYGDFCIIKELCTLLNHHIARSFPGGFDACPYFYGHLDIGKSMLVTQHAICKYVSCATCYFAHGLNSGDDHFNCLLQGESIYDFPEFTVCPSYKEDFADVLSEELSKREAREN